MDSSQDITANLFPKIETEYNLEPARRGLTHFEKGIRIILEENGLQAASVSVLNGEGGSLPVFLINEILVLKLFPHVLRTNYEAEVDALSILAGKTNCELPQLRYHGSLDGWHYVIMTRVRGVQMSTIWKTIDEQQKETLCERLGVVVADLHKVEVPTARDTGAWNTFIDQQVKGCVEQQKRHGLREELLAQIPEFIQPVMDLIKAAPTVFLHTELMLEHVFVDPDKLTIEGLIDFEPSMGGMAEYDFGAVVIFIAQGQPALLRAFLRGYGYEWNSLGVSTARLMMTLTLLHRYSRFTWYLDRLEGEPGKEIVDLVELEKKWFTI